MIDLVFVGESINKEYLISLIEKTENLIKRKIRYIVFNEFEFESYKKNLNDSEILLLWKAEK